MELSFSGSRRRNDSLLEDANSVPYPDGQFDRLSLFIGHRDPVAMTSEPEASSTEEHPIVFFDGVCGLCNSTVDFLIARDARGVLRFSPLQGETAARVLPAEIRDRLDTLVLARDGNTFIRTAAVSRILMMLGGFWAFVGGLLWLIPWPIRDLGYRCVSAVRYRFFGKHETCRMPTPEERARFLT